MLGSAKASKLKYPGDFQYIYRGPQYVALTRPLSPEIPGAIRRRSVNNSSLPPTRPDAARYLRRMDAARYIESSYGFPCSPRWLAKLAVIGGGPVFRKAGRIPIYAPADLDGWAQSRIGAPQKSTSDKI